MSNEELAKEVMNTNEGEKPSSNIYHTHVGGYKDYQFKY